jgi:hypothetical protein
VFVKAILVMLLLTASAAGAQTGDQAGNQTGNQAGTVGPSTIPGETREQKLFAIQEYLKSMDVNADGKLTQTEWTEGGGKKAGFDTLDTNRDSILTVQELRSNSRKLRAFEDFEAAAPY